MNWSLIIGILAGLGTTIATLTALESYISGKFTKAVEGVILQKEIFKRLDRLQAELNELIAATSRDLSELNIQVQRCKDANLRQHAQINALRIQEGKTESAIRAIADEEQDRTITAIFESTAGVTR